MTSTPFMKTTIALLLTLSALALAAYAQKVGPTTSVLQTNVTTRAVVLQVTTTRVVRHEAAPVVWNGQTNWLTKDVVVSERSVTNAAKGGRFNRP